ncbi:hypothetical protein [Thermomonospora cellulosilytica]|uniref:Uncharacterized protein n=1 Tax=Thermomonospora cellulosilytica TaxID=1411118 RepID=A0A7W3N0A1_9ACTN|nr:hypothetical protein [Thermomonospora cellulosilytica]MBA9005186.1 hypothetical protein [Thermomonospora cellulosilytica]
MITGPGDVGEQAEGGLVAGGDQQPEGVEEFVAGENVGVVVVRGDECAGEVVEGFFGAKVDHPVGVGVLGKGAQDRIDDADDPGAQGLNSAGGGPPRPQRI